MRRAFFFLSVLVLLSPLAASAQELQAVVKQFSGKVEVKQVGQDWKPVQLNMSVPQGATVSTGFSSRLTLELGQTEITIQPLTRMLLRELIKKDTTNVTALTLRVGKINAAVKAVAGERNNFTVAGPNATAAVRGTEFNFDVNLDDEAEGISGHFYLVSNATGQETSVGPGMFGSVGDRGRLRLPDQIIAQHSSSGWIPSDLLWWASSHEGGFTLGAYTDNLTPPNVLPAAAGIATAVTVTVN
jgi:hypothetical protein